MRITIPLGVKGRSKAKGGRLKVMVSSHPNPDHGETITPAPNEEFESHQYADLSRFARIYIEKYDLGAGNFHSEVWKGGKRLGYVSYNGRVWKDDPITGKSELVYDPRI